MGREERGAEVGAVEAQCAHKDVTSEGLFLGQAQWQCDCSADVCAKGWGPCIRSGWAGLAFVMLPTEKLVIHDPPQAAQPLSGHNL